MSPVPACRGAPRGTLWLVTILGASAAASARTPVDEPLCGRAAHPAEAGLRAENPGRRWTTCFDGRGFRIEPAAAGWARGLEVVGFGFAGAVRAVEGPPRVRAQGARVSCALAGTLEEWHVNDARGLEHGYTVHRRPAASTRARSS